jgi:hypothetical protein
MMHDSAWHTLNDSCNYLGLVGPGMELARAVKAGMGELAKAAVRAGTGWYRGAVLLVCTPAFTAGLNHWLNLLCLVIFLQNLASILVLWSSSLGIWHARRASS